MAEGGDINDVIASFKKFNLVGLAKGKDPNKMTNQAWGKMVQDCIGKDTTTKQRMDSSVWPYVSDKATKTLDLTNAAKCNEALDRAAKVYKEIKKSKDSEDDIRKQLAAKICSSNPDIKKVAQSSTGGVGRMTDTSGYTGAHKERFDESGKGKGAAGREDKSENTGYTGQYKGTGSYGKK
ncbi:tubulin polymerization-promoting protein family member 3-like [Mytilus trossulus]|uniref:tubulin polymerization-promoting protein family member 3-like n=1 Tax=Mytilus trossulus TaxID=6551 RepID=UPI0030076860